MQHFVIFLTELPGSVAADDTAEGTRAKRAEVADVGGAFAVRQKVAIFLSFAAARGRRRLDRGRRERGGEQEGG